uniref:Protein FAR1-RELATED SEQUENCE n=1 Tax=Elaeophora elaphi TaxID=1147741 RepID=A0A0R3RRG3_9BILA
MHNRIEDVKSGSDDNGDNVDGKSADKVCLDGIDTRKYVNFLGLFNTLKKRNAYSVHVDHIERLSSVQQEGLRCKNVSVVEDSLPSTSFQHSNTTIQNSNGEHVFERYQTFRESQPISFSNMDLTTIPTNFVHKKLELHVDEQTCSAKIATLRTTSSTNKVFFWSFRFGLQQKEDAD